MQGWNIAADHVTEMLCVLRACRCKQLWTMLIAFLAPMLATWHRAPLANAAADPGCPPARPRHLLKLRLLADMEAGESAQPGLRLQASQAAFGSPQTRLPGSILKGLAPRALIASPEGSPRAGEGDDSWNTLAEVWPSMYA